MNRFLMIALVIAIVAGCGGFGSTTSPGPAATPSATDTAVSVRPTVSPTVRPTPAATARPTSFPTGAFAALSDQPAPASVAEKFQAALADMADGGGITAAVMTPDGTWSGAFGTADGVHDVSVDSQFGIASGTKPIVAAQVMQLVEAGEISLDAPATDYLPTDFTSTPTEQRSASS